MKLTMTVFLVHAPKRNSVQKNYSRIRFTKSRSKARTHSCCWERIFQEDDGSQKDWLRFASTAMEEMRDAQMEAHFPFSFLLETQIK